MIYINEENIREIVRLEELMEAIEEAYIAYENNSFIMPDRIHINNKSNTLLYMPCITEKVFGTKMITVFPDNKNLNEPVIQGVMMLNDSVTGTPVCMINGASLTAYRTGAVGGVGLKYITPKHIKSIGVIGAGVQGYYQALYACKVRNIETINIFDLSLQSAQILKTKLQESIDNIVINISKSSSELLENSEAVYTCTTTNKPVLPDDKSLLENKYFIGIGSYKPDMREFPEKLFEVVEEVYVDTAFAKEETGDLITPLSKGWLKESQIKSISTIIKDKKQITKKTMLFKSVGMALFDIYTANAIYKKALEKGVGTKIKL
ncbi:ornithine cyclodeaminase family protein [Clostridiaceae bacterium M8S5]|nr:ornithine cyclodeaminase family protein [Clostridiaceae bacterium M8S5]